MIKNTLQDKLLKKFLGQSGIAFGIRVAWAVVSYAGIVFLARWLDSNDYGTYAFVISLITFLAVVCSFGTPTALIRFLGEYRGQNKLFLIRSVIRAARRSVAIATVLVALAGALFFFSWSKVDPGLQPVVFITGMLLLPAFAMSEVQGAIARSFGSIIVALGPRDVFWRLTLIPLGFFATHYFAPDMQLPVFMSGAVICLWLFVVCQWIYVRKLLPPTAVEASGEGEMSTWRQVAIPIWFAAIAVVSFRTVDVLFLGMFVPQEDVGKYFAASRTASLVSFVLISINIIVGPEVSKLYHSGETAKLVRVLKLASLLVFFPSLLFFLVLLFAGEHVLAIFGTEFQSAKTELTILAFGELLSASAGCVGIVMNMTGHQKEAAKIQITSAFATTVAMVSGAWLAGTVGVACAVTLGIALWNGRMWWYVRRFLKLDPSVFGIVAVPR